MTASYGQYSAHGVATGTTECMLLGLGVLFRLKISAICSKKALFPYNDSCHVNYSAHEVSVP